MEAGRVGFAPVAAALADLVGAEYVEAVCGARAVLAGQDPAAVRELAARRVEFLPAAVVERVHALLPRVGDVVCPGLRGSPCGAGTEPFAAHSTAAAAPLSGFGPYRVGEDGRLRLITKSEHYHAPLGHAFPGYELLEIANRLGIPNPTHNNTRGTITRRLEEELVRTVAGLAAGDGQALERLRSSRHGTALNRVLNLETGSLAAEAALKLVLSRYHRIQEDAVPPDCPGWIPVIVVVGDDDGGPQANYHGTTVLTQCLRGLWPEVARGLEAQGLLRVRTVRPNRVEDLRAVFATHGRDRCRLAAVFTELILMNYGARRLSEEFVGLLDELCRQNDVPLVVDEIQTCLWSPRLYLFREYGIQPSFVVLGKGMPGGQYAASRTVFGAAYDRLPLFGALVTNGQEEIASLAYLITMRWAEANAAHTEAVGAAYEAGLRALAARFPGCVSGIEGRRHLGGIAFRDLAAGKRFATELNRLGLDISVQSYKASCPPVALTKLPLVADQEVAEAVLQRMHDVLVRLTAGG